MGKGKEARSVQSVTWEQFEKGLDKEKKVQVVIEGKVLSISFYSIH